MKRLSDIEMRNGHTAFILIAQNIQEACVLIKGVTIKDCLERFDSEYHRTGFKIAIKGTKDWNSTYIKHIKTTYK